MRPPAPISGQSDTTATSAISLPCRTRSRRVLRESSSRRWQIVDISRIAKHDDLGHDQFVSVAVLYSRLHDQAARYRNTAGTFIFADDDETFLRPIDIGDQVAAQ